MATYWPVAPNAWPFAIVGIDSPTASSFRLYWEISSGFEDAEPWLFQPQINYSGDDPDGWEDFGDPVEGVWQVALTRPASKTKVRPPSIRVVLTTGSDVTYASNPVSCAGALSRRLQLYAQAIVRRLRLERVGLPRLRGWLLKRKLSGTKCGCEDSNTGLPTSSCCSRCFGTGIVGGYWKAVDAPLLICDAAQLIDQLTPAAGHIAPTTRTGLLLGLPLVRPRDIWADDRTGERFQIVQARDFDLLGVPIITSARLALLQADDIVYSVPIAN